MNDPEQSLKKTFSSEKEGPVARAIEKQTSKVPSDFFLYAAVLSMGASALLQYFGDSGDVMARQKRRDQSLFVGQWAPAFLIFGLYNKLVKQLGSDRAENKFKSSIESAA